MKTRPTPRPAFTLVELLVVIAIIGILVALLLPAVQAAREAARRVQCQNNIKNIALACLNYENTRSELPPSISQPDVGSASMGSQIRFATGWAIEILPFMEEQALFDTFDFSDRNVVPISRNSLSDGDSVANWMNVIARGTDIPTFLCPSEDRNDTKFQGRPGSLMGDNWARGNYAANSGAALIHNPGGSNTPTVAPSIREVSDAPWSGKSDASLNWPSQAWPPSIRGAMGPNGGTRLAQIVDGTSKSMMICEIRAGIDETDPRGVWAMPHASASVVTGHGAGGDASGPNNCLSPASDDVSVTLIAPQFCVGGSKNLEAQALCMTCNPSPFAFGFSQGAARSAHFGGLFYAHADGSVAFASDDIESAADFGACCTVWDHLIMSADQDFTSR